jgi:hypothetical protein
VNSIDCAEDSSILSTVLPTLGSNLMRHESRVRMSLLVSSCLQCAPGDRDLAGGEMITGHDFDASSTSSSSNCPNVSCIASAAPPPSASSASFDG